MAVQVLQDWTTPPTFSGTTDPSGAVTLGTGTNRTLIFVQQGLTVTQSTTASVAIGGQPATGFQAEKWAYDSGSAHVQCWLWWWDEAACAAISAGGSSNISYSDDEVNFRSRVGNYATFGSVDQASPITIVAEVSAFSASTAYNDYLEINYGGSAGDYVNFFWNAINAGTSADWFDGTVTSKWSVGATDINAGAGVGAWASTATKVTHDNVGVDRALGVVAKINQLAQTTASGSGSIDGLIATIAGVGERVITGVGSIDSLIATMSGAGSFPSDLLIKIARIVRLDDESYGFKTILQEDPSTHAEHLRGETRKGVFILSDFHASVKLL